MRLISFASMILLAANLFAAPLNKIVVFGDSLSDNGNLYEYMKHQLPLSPPYYQGRFTNGPVWVELLTKAYFPEDTKAHLLDYAFGGAGVAGEQGDDDDALFTLRHEVDSYLLAHQDKVSEDSLVILWMGSNNYLTIPEDVDQAVDDVLWGIRTNIDRLVEKGMKQILLINIPDLGHIPAARDFDAVDILSDCSVKHNQGLFNLVEAYKLKYPQVKWMYFDVTQMLYGMLDHPEQYGFTNVSDTCYEEMIDHPSARSVLNLASKIKLKSSNNADACNGYLFFDPVHPSAVAHQMMAEQIMKLFAESNIEFSRLGLGPTK
jgi:phospholipase/lecithinase/hemolysin